MPAPKRQRIVDAVADRLETIGHTVFRNRREPNANELPCFLVYSGPREAQQANGNRKLCSMTISVVGYRRLDDNESDDVGDAILADIAQAVELSDDTLGGLLHRQPSPGLAFVSDQLFMPENGENVVAGEVIYSAPHVRIDGDPEIT